MRIHGSDTERRQSDANDIRGLYLATMDGWNRGSGEAFAAPFADELDFVAFDGTRFRGRAELIRFHDPLFKTHLKGTRLVGDVTDIRFLAPASAEASARSRRSSQQIEASEGGPDVAVVHAYGGTVLRGKREAAPERDSVQTLVAVKSDGRWRFVAFQNTRVRPIGRNVLGTLCWLIGDWFWKWSLPRSHPRPPMTSSITVASCLSSSSPS
jgi:uncharacterized protein (TIGR02246 family)